MQNQIYMSPENQVAFLRFKTQLLDLVQTERVKLPARDLDIFMLRVERYFTDFYEPFLRLYAKSEDFEQQLAAVGQQLVTASGERKNELKLLDLEREITPNWFERETMVGGIYYVDRFAANLKGLLEHLDYIKELDLNYIHLMPLLKPRAGQNDGGYAVEDYCQVNPLLGNMSDLENLTEHLHANGMSLCIDLVVNHTAKEHEWARRARRGEAGYLDYYLTFDDRTQPDAYEQTLPQVFPEFKPGNFTYYPDMAGGQGKWVWTTFNEYQWDLNYRNPAVFRGMLDYMLFLANRGVDILRLDAVPFMWKRLGTNCQNQPEVHELLQAFRALVRIVAPGVLFKAEAIVAPYDLIHYLGTGSHIGRECEIAYHNSLMVLIWSALASRKVVLMTHSLMQMPPTPPGTTWVTYVRLHDDIGWAITPENAGAVGENDFLHRRFLNEFYSGSFPGSFAAGEVFQFDPTTGEGRISGMTASLAGLEQALAVGKGGQLQPQLDLAVRRILLLYSVAFSYGGIPLIYMGDEIGLLNDYTFHHDALKKDDNRWMHRPPMDWAKAEERHSDNLTGRIYQEFRALIAARKHTLELDGTSTVQPFWTGNEHVFGYVRYHPTGRRLVVLCNFSEQPQRIAGGNVWNSLGSITADQSLQDVRQPHSPTVTLPLGDNLFELEPYQTVWLRPIPFL